VERVDVVARRWALEHEWVRVVDKATATYDLDPQLLERLEDAARAQDRGAFDRALLAAVAVMLDALED
jgi:hypothetical protein